ncbi:hypothetical protein [Microaceticoccus formicicus]|uniref:hypothetical protein n=1 Tax=Microaceticoccus formicicus TaxID=3118105 RepID=UPI003CD024F6|nr:hypothetical protein VZL98_11515 [Peptoniphilaceae bacterium AMB_02]
MKKDFSDTDRLDEIREHLNKHANYNEYNNAEKDRYDKKTYHYYEEDDYDYDDEQEPYNPYDPFTDLSRSKNINKQNQYFGRSNNNHYYNDYDYNQNVQTKKRGCGCGNFFFGCCLGTVIILAILGAFITVALGGIDAIFRLIF